MKIVNNTLVLENAGDHAMLLNIFDYWNKRWYPSQDHILQAIPKDVINDLNAAWKVATDAESTTCCTQNCNQGRDCPERK